MRNHQGCKRAFIRNNKTWYARDEKPTIFFGMYNKEGGGTSGEMKLEWIELNGISTPRLKCFDDAWSALSLFKDLIDQMAEVDSQNITEEEFVDMLKECGFEDRTEYEEE